MKIIEPSKDDIKIYCWVVFGYLSGLIPLRSFQEKGGYAKPPNCLWVEADDNVADKVFEFAKLTDQKQMGCYAIPAVVEAAGQARSSDIKQMQVLLIDLDNGDIESKLALLQNVLGEATLIVESGGLTCSQQAKLHVYWQLTKAVMNEDLQKLLKLRHKIALAVGGDVSFKSAHQPIRVAGSIYHKNGIPKLVKIRSYSRLEYELEELIENANRLPANDVLNVDPLNFNNAASNISSTLVNKVYEGGTAELTRFDALSKVIGYWLRRYHEGIITEAEAIEEIHSYNLANVVPPWSLNRLKQEISGLWKLHLKKYGEPKEAIKQVSTNKINSLSLRSFLEDKSDLPQDIIAPRILTPKGMLVLGGSPKVGKSDFVLSLFVHMAAGVEFLGFKPARPLKIFYLQTEVEYHYLRERIHKILLPQELLNVTQDNLFITSRSNMLLDEKGVNEVIEHIKKNLNNTYIPDIIAVDPIRNVFDGGRSGATENENDAMMFFLRQRIEILRDQINPKAGIVLVHHTKKMSNQQLEEDPFQAFSGASSLRGYYTTGIILYKPEADNNKRHLIFELRNGDNIPTKVVQKTDGVWSEISVSEERVANKMRGRLYDRERERRIKVIIRLLEAEALRGKFYLMRQFAEKYQNHTDLGGRRAIYDDCTVAATKGIIKFFDNPEKYGVKLEYEGKGFGFICTEAMRIRINKGKEFTYIKILPTHIKNECDGRKEKIIL